MNKVRTARKFFCAFFNGFFTHATLFIFFSFTLMDPASEANEAKEMIDASSSLSQSCDSVQESVTDEEVHSKRRANVVRHPKYTNACEEANKRMWKEATPNRLDLFLRNFYREYKGEWVELEEVRKFASRYGYKGQSNVFRSTWVFCKFRANQKLANKVGHTQPWGHHFAYFETKKVRLPEKRLLTRYLRLAPEFFKYSEHFPE